MLKHIFLGVFRGLFKRNKARKLIKNAAQLWEEGATQEAIGLYRTLTAEHPQSAEAHNDLGIALQFIGDLPGARSAFETAIANNPAYFPAHYNLALLAMDLNEPDIAELHIATAAQFLGNTAEILAAKGRLAGLTGSMVEAAQFYLSAWSANRRLQEAADSYLLALATLDNTTPQRLFDEHHRIGQTYHVHSALLETKDTDRSTDRPLLVAYLSPDFREHSVRYFFEPLIAHHDRQHFRIICYNDTGRSDDYTYSIRARSDHWRDTAGWTDEKLAHVITRDRPDILVELAGHTAGNRLSMLAHRLAPIQISGIGYPPTTGVPNIDYKISDPVADPAGADAWYSEKLLRLNNTFWCYTPPPDCPLPAPAPWTQNGFVTFGCFGNLGKIGDTCMASWGRILDATPSSRILIKSIGLGSGWAQTKFRQRLAKAGIDNYRVELQGASAGREFQRAFGQVDLILDTYPFNGGTTSAHALWMSVPVLTRSGNILVSRMGATMLNACGHPELIADTWDDYVAKAIALAYCPEQLSLLRSRLRDEMVNSSLCDGKRYVSELEAAYRHVWRLWCNNPTDKEKL